MNKLMFAVLGLLLVCGVVVGSIYFRDLSDSNKVEIEAENDPDLPSVFKPNISKKEFMLKRAEQIGMFRGVEKDKPFNPQLRIDGIKKIEDQEAKVAELPESKKKDALTAAWIEIGPNPIPNGQVQSGMQLAVSGRTISIAVHPTDPNTVYVGTAQGGLYRTTDGGSTWTPLLDNALSLAIGAIAIAPSQPDTVYVGTGEPNFSADSFFGVGVYRITNASSGSPTISAALNKNASNNDVFTGTSVSRIAVDPTNPDNIFVATSFGLGGIGAQFPSSLPPFGIFRSTNATTVSPTFTKLSGVGSSNLLNITDVVIDPGDSNRLLVAAGDAFGVGGAGVYLSTNALAVTPIFSLTRTVTGTSRVELAINRVAGITTVFAATGEGNGRVYRSIDGGTVWTTQITNGFCGGQCFYNVAIAVDPNDASRVYLGGTGNTLTFGFSTNGGTSFTASQSGLHTDTHAIAVAPSQISTIYFASDGGIYKSADSGATWATLNNNTFRATQFMSIAVHPTDPNFSIGGTQDNGTNFYRPDATWTRVDFGDGGYSLIDQNAPDTTNVRMYHTYFNNSGLNGYATVGSTLTASEGNWVFRGCNGVAGNGISCTGSVLFYAPIEQGPGNPNTIYFGSNILYRSADTGINHVAVSQNLTDPISAIGISPQNDNVRIVGTNSGGIFGTSTGSTTLTNLDPGNAVPNNYVGRAIVDPNDINTAYVTLSAFGVTNIWKTSTLSSFADTGNIAPTWTAAAGSGGTVIPQIPINAFLVDPMNSSNLFAGTDIGVYTSTDGGATWNPFGTGLPRVAVFDMAITSGRLLRIATHGRGMWQISLAPPTAAIVSVSGKVLTATGTAVNRANVVLVDNNGQIRNATTNQFGYYSFKNIEVGSGYTFTVSNKQYRFEPRIVNIDQDLTNFDLIALP